MPGAGCRLNLVASRSIDRTSREGELNGENPIVWWELGCNDEERSVAFFRDVFGWEIPFDERLGFHVVPAGKEAPSISGGIFRLRRARLPFLTLFIQVDDIEAKAASIAEHGGLILDPPSDIGGGKRICLFNEPSGVTFAMIESPADK